VYPTLSRWIPRSQTGPSQLRLTYREGSGLLRELLANCAEHGFAVADLTVEHAIGAPGQRDVTVRLELEGRGSIAELAGDLDTIDGVLVVAAGRLNDSLDD
jgi:putative Mg2+ transporter-C (MgtC) family protein